ncbi:MAG: hypothetical protein ACK44A_05490 [Roseateles sp.]
MKDTKTITVTARTPAKLVRLLDKAADAAKRTRTAELVLRLERSFQVDAKSSRGQ